MAETSHDEPGEPPAVANLSNAATATTEAVEQQIDPWSVSAPTDEQGNALAFDYEAISRYESDLWGDDALRCPRLGLIHILNLERILQEMEDNSDRPHIARALRASHGSHTTSLAPTRPLLQPSRPR